MNKQRILKQTTRLAVCLSLLLAAGCSIDQDHLANIIASCAEHDGVFRVHPVIGGAADVTCRDGTWINNPGS